MSHDEKNFNFTGSVNASGGRGGDGCNGGNGGDGGNGGSVHFVQIGKEFTSQGITIEDVKNPHRQYWRMIFKKISRWIANNIVSVVVGGLILAYFIYRLGWNK